MRQVMVVVLAVVVALPVTIGVGAGSGAGALAQNSVGEEWWDARWGYRLGFDVGAAGFERVDAVVSVPVDFSAAFGELGIERVLDPVSIRVVEVDAAGGVVDGAVPFQFDPADGFDAGSNAVGELWLELTGTTAANGSRSFDVYFDVVGSDLPAAVVAPRVTATDGVEHNGLATIEVSTESGTYFYDTAGAGFASVIDTEGNDWLSWSDAPGSAGEYRGIPNMVYPEGHFHPGNGGSSTTLVSSGPLVASFRSITDDGLWRVEWSVTPDRARMRVLDADGAYWFLYEGTPGGVLEPASDIVVTADGATTDASESWSGDLVGDEWVSFGDPAVGRSLYVANHQGDAASDSYRPMNGEMTVFGFGRDGLKSELDHVPGVYSFGLVDATTHGDVAPVVERNTTPVTASITSVETQLGVDGAAIATFAIERDTEVVAVFAEQGTESGSLDVQTDGPGSVTVDPDQPSYTVGDEVTLTAAPAQDAVFLGWSGDATGTQNPVTVTIDSTTSVTATFAAVGDGPTIDVWGGAYQHFGHLGVPQSAVNVLGNVSDPDGLASIEYRFNGGAATTPRVGPDGRRLARPGDFNVELPVANLNDGLNDLRITAVDGLGDVSIVDVAVHFDAGNAWPNPYTIDWSTVADVRDVAQVVDGKWAIEGDGLRIIEADYDRLVAIGDIAWDDYEISFPVTINAIDERGFSSGPGGTSAGLGLLNRWGGHTDDPTVTSEPKSGWRPMGSIAWWSWDEIDSARLQIMNNGGGNMASTSYGTPPAVGSTLMYRMRVETQPDGTSQHSLKVWDASGPEPDNWTLQGTQTVGRDTGSVMLLAHFVDATFGDVSVTPVAPEPTGLSVDVTTSGSGSVAVDPDQPEYAAGDEVTLTATPDPDWVFTGWSGDLSGTDNPTTITLNESIQLAATFAPVSGEPVISGVAVAPSADSAVVSWNSNVSTTGSVAYGETTSYELGAESSASGTDHSVTIPGLTPETTYHFQITADDGQGGVSSTADATFATTAVAEPSGFVSDDFNACAVDGSVWSFVDPVGDGSMVVNGTQLELSVPAGTTHDAWGANEAPRLMQAVNDADFELLAKFESTVSEKYEMQGWIIEQDADNYLRFDVHGTGSGQRVFVARIVNGSPTAIANKAISFSQPVWLRVGRSGDDWTMSYSTDGAAFTEAAGFAHPLAVSHAGVFAGNAGKAPDHTAVVDYVFDIAAPIADEDADAVTCP